MKFTMRTITTSFIFLTFIVICNPIFAQFTEKEFDVDLWANGLPNTNGIDHTPFDDNIKIINLHYGYSCLRKKERPGVLLLLARVVHTVDWLIDMRGTIGLRSSTNWALLMLS